MRCASWRTNRPTCLQLEFLIFAQRCDFPHFHLSLWIKIRALYTFECVEVLHLGRLHSVVAPVNVKDDDTYRDDLYDWCLLLSIALNLKFDARKTRPLTTRCVWAPQRIFVRGVCVCVYVWMQSEFKVRQRQERRRRESRFRKDWGSQIWRRLFCHFHSIWMRVNISHILK